MLSVAILFSVVASGALIIELYMPKSWECSALLVPDAATIKPLLEGRGGGQCFLFFTQERAA